jgi:hypothetical protein
MKSGPLPAGLLAFSLLFIGCAASDQARFDTYRKNPSCVQSRAKCKEYKRAQKQNKEETVGLRLLREDCEGYKAVCAAEMDQAAGYR